MGVKNTDISRILNISTATVSLARNNKPGVSERTRNSINEVINQLSQQNETQIGIRENQGSLVFVIHKKHGLVINDSRFFLQLTEAVQREAEVNNYSLQILYYNESDDISNNLIKCSLPSTGGILLLAAEMREEDIKIYADVGKPLVLIDSHYPGINYDTVILNNKDAVRKSVIHAFDRGHRSIGYLRSSVYTANFAERYDAYVNTMRELGLSVDQNYIFDISCTHNESYKDMQKNLRGRDKSSLPTAIIAGNDILAVGALKAMRESDISIPDDVSMIGFDDIPMANLLDPPLTTVRTFNVEIARMAMRRMVDRITNPDLPAVKIEVGTEFIVRESVKTL